eukprot:scaffold20462_cov28-Tisochrysis_lutea.AAC.1
MECDARAHGAADEYNLFVSRLNRCTYRLAMGGDQALHLIRPGIVDHPHLIHERHKPVAPCAHRGVARRTPRTMGEDDCRAHSPLAHLLSHLCPLKSGARG